jgi:hypothetical protein
MITSLLLDYAILGGAAEGLGQMRGDGKVYARAAPEKVEITEEYSVTQEISSNPNRDTGPSAGHIEIAVPYDGQLYFSRQAADDVELGNRVGNGQGTAVIGHLLLADHTKTGDLRSAMTLHHNSGVIPIEVPVPTGTESLDQLTADRQTHVISYDYRPDTPEILPIQLDVELYDLDAAKMAAVDLLAGRGDIALGRAIAWLRQDPGFASGLELSISVQLDIPVKPSGMRYLPRIALMSVDWPVFTSLSSTQLERDKAKFERSDGDDSSQPHSVRYNPVLGRLEWENIPMEMHQVEDAGGSVGVALFKSVGMRLKIRHPGELFTTSELFKEQTLKIRTEVEIEGYLLSGLEAWLFDATGDWQRRPRPDAPGSWVNPRERNPWQPKLSTLISVDTECRILDKFAERLFWPYQQFVFDDVIPNEMRITDIVTVLRNAKFDVDPPSQANLDGGENPDSLQWLLRATRRQGPDTLSLIIAVDGKKFVIKLSGTKESGRIQLSVLGGLPREHADLTREMNLLQQALRDRFRFQQTTRG